MDFNAQLEFALARVSKTGIWQSNYAPPIYRCLWLAGLQVRPPHFATFAFNSLFSGLWFTISWAFVMCLMLWSNPGLPNTQIALFAVAVGTTFGVVMATYYSISARRHGLPQWIEIERA